MSDQIVESRNATITKPPESRVIVPRHHPDYLSHLRSDDISASRDQFSAPFSQRYLNIIDDARKTGAPDSGNRIARALNDAKGRIKTAYAKSDEYRYFFKTQMLSYFFTGRLNNQGDVIYDVDPAKLANMDFTYTQLKEAFRMYGEDFERKRAAFKTKMQGERPEFEKSLLDHIALKGWNVDVPALRRRISQINLDIMDPLYGIENNRLGLYYPNEDIATIRADLPGGAMVHVAHHEELHGISGKAITAKKGPDGKNQYSVEKLGLRLLLPSGILRHSWLNEALTEKLNQQLHGPTALYHNEIALYNLLISSWAAGRPDSKVLAEGMEQSAYEAWFEDPFTIPGKNMVQWRTFRQTINNAYYDGILVDLDDIVQSEELQSDGVKLAMESLQNYQLGRSRLKI